MRRVADSSSVQERLTVDWDGRFRLFVFLLAVFCSGCGDVDSGGNEGTGVKADPGSEAPSWQPIAVDSPPQEPAGEDRGRELSRSVCGTCHLYPEPDVLDRVTWAMEVLPQMELWMGLRLKGEDPYAELHLDPRAKAAKVIPEASPLTVEQWRTICSYYLDEAPFSAAPQPERNRLRIGLTEFQVERPSVGLGSPMTTLARFDPDLRRVYVGGLASDLLSGFLSIHETDGNRTRRVELPSPPVDLEILSDRLLVTLMGDYTPSDRLYGAVIQMPRRSADGVNGADVLSGLPRPVQTRLVDLNSDGLEDLLVCGFGHTLGKLMWFEKQSSGGYEERVLLEHNGVVCARVVDHNKDGRMDVVVMTAQQRETVQLLTNLGKGEFAATTLIEKHPAWGFVGFELIDMNGDGHPDLVTANGDNGDYSSHIPSLKAYHGYRIYLNDGNFGFEESWFYPAHGAFQMAVRDFDADGDLDLATVSFYADYGSEPNEGFIYFQNDGGEGLDFTPKTFQESNLGRWMTLDARDFDGDGDIDIVLASQTEGPSPVPSRLDELWAREGPPFLILRNQLRDPER